MYEENLPHKNRPPTSQMQRAPASRYGGGSAQERQSLVDPTEWAPATARAFLPAPAMAPAAERAMGRPRQPQQYGSGVISLGRGHEHGQAQQHYRQLGSEDNDGGPSGVLPRHSSSPPWFFSSLVQDNADFASVRAGVAEASHATNTNKKLKSPLNSAREGNISRIPEDGIRNLAVNLHGAGCTEDVHSSLGRFSIGSWEDSSVVFSMAASKPAGTHNNGDIIGSLGNYESQYIMPSETVGMDKYLQRQQDQVPFRAPAKRGCATHPRSIAERERRIRISDKLKKLEALVPNMDKEASTADMLDQAVEHIRGLQRQLQALEEEREKCTCLCKKASGNRSID